MKRVRPDALACQLQPPRNPRLSRQLCTLLHTPSSQSSPSRSTAAHHDRSRQWRPCQGIVRPTADSRRWQSSTAAAVRVASDDRPQRPSGQRHVDAAGSIARLSALHARLQLPPEFPLSTLARCLIHSSADPNPARNNASLAILGQDLLAYYTSEHIIVNYPRLPVPILFAAQYAYSGPATLAALRAEWGIELAAAPGPEVNRAVLQFVRIQPGNALAQDGISQIKDLPSNRRMRIGRLGRDGNDRPRRGMSNRIANDDEFGELRPDAKPYPGAAISKSRANAAEDELSGVAEQTPNDVVAGPRSPVSAEMASATFVRALAGALSLHSGDAAVKQFHKSHILSRHFELHKLFDFSQPTFDLSRLCAREDFEPPIARLLSETGRQSRTPVFVVGVFSGEDKLGEGAGASLNEARVRAAAAALRSWYLYSPPIDRIMRPSITEERSDPRARAWTRQMIDPGEIVA